MLLVMTKTLDSTLPSHTEAVERLIGNARRLAKDAFHTAMALDAVCPVRGRTWINLCFHCATKVDPHDECPTYRLASASWMTFPGGCAWCPYSGCDTLVVSISTLDLVASQVKS